MAFKLRQPIKIDPVARYEVPFQPDNFEDKTGLVARANDNGNMIVNKNIPKDSKLRKVAESHEDHHLRDIMDGKLAYDDKAVYHNMDGKGMKRTPRSEFNESNRNLPWEAPAYAAGEKMEQKDMRPNPEKLDGPPNMYDDTPLAFVKQMGKRKRSSDIEKVSMNERFGTAMIKKFGKGFNLEVKLDDTNDEGEKEKEKLKAKAKANAEAELAKKNYNQETLPDGRIKFSKSAEGSASGTDNVVIGSKAKSNQTQATDGDAYIQRLLDSGKTRQEVMEGSLVSSKYYDLFPSSTETATASDEYFEDGKKEIIEEKEERDPCEEGYFFSAKLNSCQKKSTGSSNKRKKNNKSKKLKQDLSVTKGNTEVCKVDDTPKEKKRKGCGYNERDAKRDKRKSNRKVNKSGVIKF